MQILIWKCMKDKEGSFYNTNFEKPLTMFQVFLLWEMLTKDTLILKSSNYIYYNSSDHLRCLLNEIKVLIWKELINSVIIKLHNYEYWNSPIQRDFLFDFSEIIDNNDYLSKNQKFCREICPKWWDLEIIYKINSINVEKTLVSYIEDWRNNKLTYYDNNLSSIKQLEIVSRIMRKSYSRYWDNTNLYVDFSKIPSEMSILFVLIYLNQVGIIEFEKTINEKYEIYGDIINELPTKFRLKIKDIKRMREYSNMDQTVDNLNDKIWYKHPYLERVENMNLYVRDSNQKLELTKIQEKVIQKFLKNKSNEIYLNYEIFCDSLDAFKKMLTRFNIKLKIYGIRIKKLRYIQKYKIEKIIK